MVHIPKKFFILAYGDDQIGLTLPFLTSPSHYTPSEAYCYSSLSSAPKIVLIAPNKEAIFARRGFITTWTTSFMGKMCNAETRRALMGIGRSYTEQVKLSQHVLGGVQIFPSLWEVLGVDDVIESNTNSQILFAVRHCTGLVAGGSKLLRPAC